MKSSFVKMMNTRFKYGLGAFLGVFLLFISSPLKAQEPADTALIQFSGFVITADSSAPVPYTTIKVIGEPRGAVSNPEGFFSTVVEYRDTIRFSSVGFKPDTFVVANHTQDHKLKHVQPLVTDTTTFEEAVVHPYPTKDEFKEAFMNLELPNDKFTIAQRNLQARRLNQIARNLPKDAREQYNLAQQRFHNQSFRSGGNLRYFTDFGGSGTPVPGSLLNPFAWSKFINAIQEGRFSED
jgi:hypothetical protein